ncbi:MAG: DUF4337 family protein [Candidatus Eremiobacteraeota bacterium]|nr:DUF4337 family protein [Candidatus Eremiobacteraeota bacterium]
MPDYLAHEGLEHAERAHEHVQGTSDPFMRFVPIAAAVLAVCAGLSSLYGNRLAERMLKLGSSSVLSQTQASDTWAEYEAQSLKAHVAASFATTTSDPKIRKQLEGDVRNYRTRQVPLYAEARQLESATTASVEAMEVAEAKKLRFDVATAVFQISIVLASISAMTKRPPLFIAALVGFVLGIVSCVVGLLH